MYPQWQQWRYVQPWRSGAFTAGSAKQRRQRRGQPQSQPAWYCSGCGTSHNDAKRSDCRACMLKRAEQSTTSKQQSPPSQPAWFCSGCGTSHHDVKRNDCRSCKLKRVAQPSLAEAPTPQGGPWQQPQTKAATKEALKATGGLTKADLEFVAKLQRRQTLDSEGGYPTLPSAPTAPTEDQLKQLKTWRSSLAALQDVEEALRDHELIAAYQKKVDHLLGKHTTQSGEERESARLHRIMGTLKTTHAAAMDAHNKEKEAATRDLDTAKARLAAAEQAVATAQADFKRRQGQVADLLSHAESQGAESEDSGEHVIPVAPQMTAANLSSTCSFLIQKIREEHNLVGTDTPELNGVNNFCSLLVQEAQNAEVFAELQAAWKPPHAAPPSQDAASAASAGSGDTADRHGPDGPAALPVPMDAEFPEGW